MHDRLDHHRMNEDTELAEALRALPAETPPADTWQRLASRTRRRRNVRLALWSGLPAALAAGIALAVVWPHLDLQRGMPAPVRIAQPSTLPQATAPETTPSHAAPAADLAALQASSRQWQAWVATLDRDGAPLDPQALAQAVSLQDRIGLVDLQLSAARDPASAAGLWQQRITLLQRLGLLHLQPYAVAQQTRGAQDTTLM